MQLDQLLNLVINSIRDRHFGITTLTVSLLKFGIISVELSEFKDWILTRPSRLDASCLYVGSQKTRQFSCMHIHSYSDGLDRTIQWSIKGILWSLAFEVLNAVGPYDGMLRKNEDLHDRLLQTSHWQNELDYLTWDKGWDKGNIRAEMKIPNRIYALFPRWCHTWPSQALLPH